MKRINFYLEQVVAKEDLALLQDNIESMFASLIEDLGIRYAYNGLYADANNPVAMAVRIHPGRCYFGFDGCGKHGVLSTIQLVALNQDVNSASTAVQTNGNERWLSVWIVPKSVSDTPVITPAGTTIQYRTYDSVDFVVTMGAEAAIGAATRPALESVTNGILICDVQLTYGMTTVPNGNIDASRVLSSGQTGHERGALPYLLNTLDNTVSRLNIAEQNIAATQAELDGFESDTAAHLATINQTLSDHWTAITGLQTNKSDKGHHHPISEVDNLQTTLSGMEQEIAGKSPSNHNHDSRYHLKTGDEVHDGKFKVTQPPVDDSDVVRLGDVVGRAVTPFASAIHFSLSWPDAWGTGPYLLTPSKALESGDDVVFDDTAPSYLKIQTTGIYQFQGSAEAYRMCDNHDTFMQIWVRPQNVAANDQLVFEVHEPDCSGATNTPFTWMGYLAAGDRVYFKGVGKRSSYSRWNVVFLGAKASTKPISILNANQSWMAANGQVYPKIVTVTLTAANATGNVTWTIQGGTAESFSSISGRTLTISFPDANAYTLTLKVVDEAGSEATKSLAYVVAPYVQVPLQIGSTGGTWTAYSYPFNVSLGLTSSGGDAPITWAIVAGSNTTLPSAAVSGSNLTGSVSDEGSWTVEVQATDTGTPTPQVVTKVLTITVNTYVEPPNDPNWCFEAGSTYILMEDGSGKLLKDVKPGDMVIGVNDSSHETGLRPVRPTMVTDLILREATGDEPDSVVVQGIKSTEGHPWAVFTEVCEGCQGLIKGAWTRSKDLAETTSIVQIVGQGPRYTKCVPAGTTKRDKPVKLAGNLGTQAHTFCVGATAQGPWFLVHNLYYPSY